MAKINLSSTEAVENVRAMIRAINELKKTASTNGLKDLEKALEMIKQKGQLTVNQLNYISSAIEKNTKKVKESETAYDRLTKKFKDAEKAAKALAAEYGVNSLKARKAARDARVLRNRLEDINKTTGTTISRWSTFNKIMGPIAGMVGIYMIWQHTKMLAGSVYDLTKKLNAFNFAMEAVIRDEAELIQTREYLKRITNDYGADLIATTHRYIKFRTASREANLSMEDTQKIFETMTKAAGTLGLKTDELTGIYLALEQMISKGKVTTEELRRQLGERLPGAMDIMAKSMGVSTAKLDDMMKKGEVITKEVLPAFAEQVEIAFGLEAVTKIDTLVAAETRLKNGWAQFVDTIESGQGRISKPIIELINQLTEMLEIVEKLNRTDEDWIDISRATAYESTIKAIRHEFQLIKEANPNSEFTVKDVALANLSDYGAEWNKVTNSMAYTKSVVDSLQTESHKLTQQQVNYVKVLMDKNNLEGMNYKQVQNHFRELLLKQQKEQALWRGKIDAAKSFFKVLEKEDNSIDDDDKGKVDTSYEDLLIERKRQELMMQREIRDSYVNDIKVREQAIKKAHQYEIELLQLKANKARKLAEGNSNTITKIEEKLAFDIENMENKTADKRLDIYKKYVSKKAAEIKDSVEQEANEEISQIKAKYGDLNNLTKAEEKKLNKEVAEEKRKAHNTAVVMQAEFIKEMLELFELDAETRVALERKVQALIASVKAKGHEDGLESEENHLVDLLELLQEFGQAVGNIFDAVHARRLERIEAEIKAEEDKYKKLELIAQGDAKQEKQLAIEKHLALEKLEKKKLKEEQKRAKARKKFALFEIAINTAIAIGRLPAEAGLFGISLIPFIVALGALQAAAVLAEPIPQYKDGLELAKEDHVAMINDGGKQEYVKRGNKILTTKTKDAIVNLKKDDTVYKDYDDMVSKTNMLSILANGNQLSENDFNVLAGVLEDGIKDGFKDLDINNNITLKGFDYKREAYKNKISYWS